MFIWELSALDSDMLSRGNDSLIFVNYWHIAFVCVLYSLFKKGLLAAILTCCILLIIAAGDRTESRANMFSGWTLILIKM